MLCFTCFYVCHVYVFQNLQLPTKLVSHSAHYQPMQNIYKLWKSKKTPSLKAKITKKNRPDLSAEKRNYENGLEDS